MIIRKFLFQLDHWFLGLKGSLPIIALLSIVGWNKRWSPLCIGTVVTIWLGYIFFWFEGLPLIGPVYYFETLPFLLTLLSFGLYRLYKIAAPWPKARFIGTCLIILLYIAASVNFSRNHAFTIYHHQDVTGQYHKILATAPKNSLILVSNYPGMHYFAKGMAYNPKGLSSDPLVVKSDLVQKAVILAAFPKKKPFEIINRNGKLYLVPIHKTLPVNYHLSALDALAQTGHNSLSSLDLSQRIARAPEDKKGFLVFGKYFPVAPGDYTLTMDLSIKNVPAIDPVLVELAADNGRLILARKQVTGSKKLQMHLSFHADRLIWIEPRIHYGGSGELIATTIEIMQNCH